MAKKRSAKKVTKRSGASKKAAKKSSVKKRSSKRKGVAKARPSEKRKAKAAKARRPRATRLEHAKEVKKAEGSAPARSDRAHAKRTPDTIPQKVANAITAIFDTVAEARAKRDDLIDPERTEDEDE